MTPLPSKKGKRGKKRKRRRPRRPGQNPPATKEKKRGMKRTFLCRLGTRRTAGLLLTPATTRGRGPVARQEAQSRDYHTPGEDGGPVDNNLAVAPEENARIYAKGLLWVATEEEVYEFFAA